MASDPWRAVAPAPDRTDVSKGYGPGMATARYVALLRGINVGGRNSVPMADLRAAFESAGHTDVRTYIQSGNVLFSSDSPRAQLEDAVETALREQFGVTVVVLRSHRQLRNVVARAPDGFGSRPDTHHSDVMFLREPLTSRRVMRVLERREGVDRAWPGTGVVYFERLSARRTQSRMSRITDTAEYARMTIRNWNTTTKLLSLLDESRTG